ncbi:MAG: DUF4377 domain-containing protein [Bacteroidales bacterium]|nr:DUF4377 domain-containing protein [Bacteroidales bacterium]
MRIPIFVLLVGVITIGIYSCKKEEKANLKINHYMTSCIGTQPQLCYLQKEDVAEADNWEYGYDEIIGFEYEWGYVYELKVKIKDIENPPIDASDKEIHLEQIVSKQKVDSELTFEIPLRDEFMDAYFTNSTEYGLQLVLGINIEFEGPTLEDEFTEHVYSEGGITGIFKHKNNSTIVLVGFKE